MSRVVLIDGENLLYGLRKMANDTEEIASREMFVGFPFRALIDEVLGDGKPANILYYGARLRQYNFTPEVQEKTSKAIRMQSRIVNNLQKQGINFVKVGYLRARESEPFPECGHSEWHLLEKGVDVGLATRLIAEANDSNEIILVSSDTDLLPAVRFARSKGANVIFVGYEYQPVLALASVASSTRLITTPMVKKHLGHIDG